MGTIYHVKLACSNCIVCLFYPYSKWNLKHSDSTVVSFRVNCLGLISIYWGIKWTTKQLLGINMTCDKPLILLIEWADICIWRAGWHEGTRKWKEQCSWEMHSWLTALFKTLSKKGSQGLSHYYNTIQERGRNSTHNVLDPSPPSLIVMEMNLYRSCRPSQGQQEKSYYGLWYILPH